MIPDPPPLPGPSAPAIVVEGLTTAFGSTTALSGLSFEVEEGELFGFIGPDGAGKTTLFRILTTLLRADAGSATVLGFDVEKDLWEVRSRVGYVPGRFSLYRDLSVAENLAFFASVFGTTVEAHYDVIEPIYRQIEPFRDRRAGDLSGGMKQKLALCCALVHRPELLVLDEPTTGVDAVSRSEFWDLLAGLKATRLTIVVSTPYMDEASRCDRVALLQSGAILAIDRPQAIGRDYPYPLLAVTDEDRYGLLQVVRTYPHCLAAHPFGRELHYTDARAGTLPDEVIPELRAFLAHAGFSAAEIRAIPASIEDTFMLRMSAAATAAAA